VKWNALLLVPHPKVETSTVSTFSERIILLRVARAVVSLSLVRPKVQLGI
jgi:hypothetical protein